MLPFIENYSLKSHNTLAIDARCSAFIALSDAADLPKVLTLAKQLQLDLVTLGEGSNVVLADDVNALVIHMVNKGVDAVIQQDQVLLTAAAGENWHNLVMYCVANHYHGIENLALIPGTAGAAPVQNIGAYGVELSDVFYQLTAWDCEHQQWVTLNKADCEFAYRNSIFKSRYKGRYIISDITLRLSLEPQLVSHYPALANYLAEHCITPSPATIAKAVMAIRHQRLPDPAVTPNAGSFFKNPVVAKAHAEALLAQHPTMPVYPVQGQDELCKLAAGWLLEQAGWKGKTIGLITMHHQQSLVLTNHGGSGNDVLAVAKAIQADIAERFAITLDIEPDIIGFVIGDFNAAIEWCHI